jgi:hypothetical protein
MGLILSSKFYKYINIVFVIFFIPLTLILPTLRIWRARNNASRWQMGFNPAFKELIILFTMYFRQLWVKKKKSVFATVSQAASVV